MVGVQGADELRKVIGLDEINFRRLSPNLNGEPKKYFLYRILDEIQKAGLKILDWKEFLLEGKLDDMHRIDFESIIDDQQFRARKLVETLVDAILFSTTNDQAHYGDYFHLHELNEYARSQEDRSEFFGFHNKNAEWVVNRILENVRDLETEGFDPRSRWYIRNGSVLNEKWKNKGVPFSSFRDRYKMVLPIALPSELTIIGKSYVHAYGTSKKVHFTPHDTSSNFSMEQAFLGVDKVGILIMALIVRCQILLNSIPEGINKRYREMHDNNAMPAKLAQSLKAKPADVGDIVWIQGAYAEVIAITCSKYGYSAYHVKYIERPPLAEVPDDWFAGFEIKLVARRAQIEKGADATGKKIVQLTNKQVDRSELLESAKRAIVHLSILRQKKIWQKMGPSESMEPKATP